MAARKYVSLNERGGASLILKSSFRLHNWRKYGDFCGLLKRKSNQPGRVSCRAWLFSAEDVTVLPCG